MLRATTRPRCDRRGPRNYDVSSSDEQVLMILNSEIRKLATKHMVDAVVFFQGLEVLEAESPHQRQLGRVARIDLRGCMEAAALTSHKIKQPSECLSRVAPTPMLG